MPRTSKMCRLFKNYFQKDIHNAHHKNHSTIHKSSPHCRIIKYYKRDIMVSYLLGWKINPVVDEQILSWHVSRLIRRFLRRWDVHRWQKPEKYTKQRKSKGKTKKEKEKHIYWKKGVNILLLKNVPNPSHHHTAKAPQPKGPYSRNQPQGEHPESMCRGGRTNMPDRRMQGPPRGEIQHPEKHQAREWACGHGVCTIESECDM